MFPKEPKKKKRRRHPKSLLPTRSGTCYLCGRTGQTHEHHIFFGTGKRRLSEEYGLKVYLCLDCHEFGSNAVHNNAEVSRKLQQEGQRAFEAQCGSREQFRKIFGASYL